MKLSTSIGLSNGTPISGGDDPFPNVYSTDLDGADDYVGFGNWTDIIASGTYSISIWFKQNSSGNYFLCSGGQNNTHNVNVYLRSGNEVWIDGSVTSGFQKWTWTNTNNVWQHFLLVDVGGATPYTVYQNGVAKSSLTAVSGLLASSDEFRLGNRYLGNNFDGLIDQVSVCDAAKLPADFRDAATSKPIDLAGLSGLIAWWKMDEGTGTTTADSVGSITGTLTNGTAWSTDVP